MANETFELPLEKKMKYEMSNTGRYFGYMMKGSNVLDFKCTPDENELCAVSDNEIMKIADESTKRPETINRRWSKSKEFMILAHGVVLVVLRVLSEKVGLGPDVLPDSHKFDWKGGHQARISHSLPVNADVIPFGEHTDFGLVTILFNQLGGLQVRNPSSHEWKYVKTQSDSAIITMADSLVKLLGE